MTVKNMGLASSININRGAYSLVFLLLLGLRLFTFVSVLLSKTVQLPQFCTFTRSSTLR